MNFLDKCFYSIYSNRKKLGDQLIMPLIKQPRTCEIR